MKLFDRDLWREVFSTLTKNITITILTTLGVLFAVIILIMLLGTTNGMKNGFDKLFKGTATNSIFVWGQSTGKPYKGFERGRRVKYTFDDIKLLKENIKEIESISPRIQLGNYEGVSVVTRKGQSSGSSVYGDFPSIDDFAKKNLEEGRFLNQNDIENSRKICVIGDDVYKLLYKKEENAIGTYIEINGVYFQVVGVYRKNKNVSFDGQNTVHIPFTTYQKAFNSGNRIGWMAITVKSKYDAGIVLAKIKKLLKLKHDIHPKDTRGIGSFNLSEIFSGINAFTMVLQGFSFFIGIFTLLAGVIAISNILLITVKERTKEIGIRRALGATPKMIKRQIILEAIVLTVFSGLLGFVISVAGLSYLDSKFGDGTDFPFLNPSVSFTQLIVSFTLMLLLSLLVGLIPARKAVKMKPIEALREE
ncbi:MAG TPA: multidrug ABC transporter ATP-binding protein [Flavobacteriaceae bacterium]|nr:multidrug ABC transporter ATP-binding protein [Flavobacteriaceae bacterium]